MPDLPDDPRSRGVVTLRFPISVGNGLPTLELYSARWVFKTIEGLSGSPFPGRGPVMHAWIVAALTAPVSDPQNPGQARVDARAMIPAENFLGFVQCDKVPPSAVDLDSEAAPA
jgi:hypothetical protein